ncbi:16S rRNA (uracil(1498)-N(3))-methyltransferase [Piscinibacter sakaiensis]|uniref:Ribosomal RNA small subunit methyltransferase E n=1 Tax=Piscinibacter sakaiensis TaxID=1547922 RepID=A0A0K8P4E6_PISS1|nr:16S rRNA (uracil(1498)-N(3))-methyltransferase [Piscinibacter sakaiensis]GAP37522.1 ribosomal RNA small subunit methyltransferase E [Piscinibacter sakaiensis]
MAVRIHVPDPLAAGLSLALPPGPSRHLQVLRLQPGSALRLFDGRGGEWSAQVTRMGRQVVEVEVGEHLPVERELAAEVTLAVGMPANERMDTLVEKAVELGVAAIQPLVCERSVLRLAGERAERKAAHWQAVAVAASEQCGRNRVAAVAPIRPLADWLRGLPPPHGAHRAVLSLREARPWAAAAAAAPTGARWCVLSGPEGGLTPAEEEAAAACGFAAVSLGPRVLRADTAPLAVLGWFGLAAGG